MTRKALARRIAEPYLTSQQRSEAPAPPQPEGLRGFWPGALLLVGQRPQRFQGDTNFPYWAPLVTFASFCLNPLCFLLSAENAYRTKAVRVGS